MEAGVRGVEGTAAAAVRVCRFLPSLFLYCAWLFIRRYLNLPTHLRTHLLVFAVLCESLLSSVPFLAGHHANLSDLHVGANARERSAARGVERNRTEACGHIYLRLLCQN